MSPGVARSSGVMRTTTSYNLFCRVKVLTRRPPSMVSRVAPTSRTETPRSSALSRSYTMVSSGLLTLGLMSGRTSPANCLARWRNRSFATVSESASAFLMTYWTGWPKPPTGEGVKAKANTPGMPNNCGSTPARISWVVCDRSAQSSRLANTIPWLTGTKPPVMAKYVATPSVRSTMLSIWRMYLSV